MCENGRKYSMSYEMFMALFTFVGNAQEIFLSLKCFNDSNLKKLFLTYTLGPVGPVRPIAPGKPGSPYKNIYTRNSYSVIT